MNTAIIGTGGESPLVRLSIESRNVTGSASLKRSGRSKINSLKSIAKRGRSLRTRRLARRRESVRKLVSS
jgi:hypothetical protein